MCVFPEATTLQALYTITIDAELGLHHMALFSLSLQKILRNFLYNLLTVYVFLLMYKPKQSKALTFKNSLMVPGRENPLSKESETRLGSRLIVNSQPQILTGCWAAGWTEGWEGCKAQQGYNIYISLS